MSRLRPQFDVAAHNLRAIVDATASAPEDKSSTTADTASAALRAACTTSDSLYALRSHGVGNICVRNGAEIASAARGVAVFVVTRGCNPSREDAVIRETMLAARADTTGLLWYILDNDAPAAIADSFERQLGLDAPTPWQPSTGDAERPLTVLLDRYATTATRYVWSPLKTRAADIKDPDGPASAAELLGWTQAWVDGLLEPTLLGAERPPSDAHPKLPFVSIATSSSFADVVLDPHTDVVVEAFMSDCPMCQALSARVRMLAELVAVHLPAAAAAVRMPRRPMRVALFNVDENDRPRHWMPGPAFPSIQLFNAGSGPLAMAASKMAGPGCGTHGATPSANAPTQSNDADVDAVPYVVAAAAAASTSAEPISSGAPVAAPRHRIVGLARRGTPPCVPSLDFAHPTSPGRMALPTVPELLIWVASHCSEPFDPAQLRLPASGALRGAAARFPHIADAAVAAADVPAVAAETGEHAVPLTASRERTTLSLLELAEDMEVEARVFESGVFMTMWLGAVAEKARTVLHPAPASMEARALDRLDELVATAHAAVVENAAYGLAEAAEDAVAAAETHAESTGLIDAARRAAAAEQAPTTESHT